MSDADIAAIIRECMFVVLKLGGPILCSALVVGLFVSFFQAVTQINEATLAFLPKLAAIGLIGLMTGSYMIRTLSGFSKLVFDRIVIIGGL
jgi:flagellar biosynthetic protein FliQ